MSRSEHTMPTPAVAGWTEMERITQARDVRADFEARGGRVLQEKRVRNIAFDGPGERTTYVFVVDWGGTGDG